ncbi:MAG: hypothetical protein R2875_17230 [Desulfobacterales bacterium]
MTPGTGQPYRGRRHRTRIEAFLDIVHQYRKSDNIGSCRDTSVIRISAGKNFHAQWNACGNHLAGDILPMTDPR